MKILITGVSGFIGKSLYQFLTLKHDVYGVSRTLLDRKNCTTLDFLNKSDIVDYFDSNKAFDVVINLVSKMATGNTTKNIELFTDNIKIQSNIIEALKNYNNCIFINFSSSAVYPNISGEFSEDNIIDPSPNGDALYGLAKFNSEILFKFLFKETVKVINLRVGYVYGTKMNITRIHKVFEKELEDKNIITVFGNGERVIPQIEIGNLIKVINMCIENPISGVYNVADENISLKEIAMRLIEIKGNKESKIIYIEKGNSTKFKLNFEKIKNIYNV